jgi:DNA polymerase-3 subunit epsilon
MRWWTGRREPWDEVTYLALDLETTGLDPKRDRILSVGMVPLSGGLIRWGDRRYTLVRGPEEASGSGALGVHQILPGDTTNAPTEPEVLSWIFTHFEHSVLLVHHAPVDLRFLKASARRHRRRWPAPRVVDTVRLLGRLELRMERLEPYPPALPRGLDQARRALGLPGHHAHHALADALATAELFLALRTRLDARLLGQLL